MTNEYPEIVARFYDLIYHHIRDSVDNEFFQNEIRKANGKVLEVGVGTGRLFKEALDHHADIYGIDISQFMINEAIKKLDRPQAKRISLQNMIDFKFDFEFDLIIAPFRVIMHLQNKEDQIKAINNVYKHLKPGGKFIFDTFIPDLNQLITGIDRKTDFEGEYEPGKKFRRVVSTKPDLIHQTIHITFLFEWEENNKPKQEEWKIQLRYFFRYELEHLVERTDFEVYSIYGDFFRNELNEISKEFVVICKKQ